MRVDTTRIPSQSGQKGKTGANTSVASQRESDNAKTETVSRENGAASTKAGNVDSFSAKLEPEVLLTLGDKTLLEVTGKESRNPSQASNEETGRKQNGETNGLVREFEDKTLLPYAGKLAQLNIPVTEATAQIMRELIAKYPGMTLDEAAFIASNRLEGDESLISAALSMLADEENTAAMLERLMELLTTRGTSPEEPALANPEINDEAAKVVETPEQLGDEASSGTVVEIDAGTVVDEISDANTAADEATGVQTSQTEAAGEGNNAQQASLSEFLALVDGGETSAAEALFRGEPETVSTTAEIIPHEDSNMQSTISEKSVEIEEKFALEGEIPPENKETATERPISALENETVQPTSAETRVEQPPIDKAANTAASFGSVEEDPKNDVASSNAETARRSIVELLSELPEFRGTPASILERFSSMLLRVSEGSASAENNDMEKLEDLLKTMFTRIEKGDKDSGLRLKNAKEELFAMLALIEETITRSQPAAKTAMLEQTRRLIDHVRVLNNIDQFFYLQLPVQLSEDRKAAELYVFKKKGGKRYDLENVNILLVLELENMGHWEGLINFKNKDVSVKMDVRGPLEKEWFSDNTVLLHDYLAEAGFKLVNTDISFSDNETTPLTALSVFDRLSNGKQGVDVKV